MSDFNGKFSNAELIMKYIEENLTQLEKLELYFIREEFLAYIEKAVIQEALKRSKGRKGKAAELLGIDVKTLYNKLNSKNKMAQIVHENQQNNTDPQEIVSATETIVSETK